MHGSHLDYFRPVNKIHAKCENAKRITGKTAAGAAAVADNKKSRKMFFNLQRHATVDQVAQGAQEKPLENAKQLRWLCSVYQRQQAQQMQQTPRLSCAQRKQANKMSAKIIDWQSTEMELEARRNEKQSQSALGPRKKKSAIAATEKIKKKYQFTLNKKIFLNNLVITYIIRY